MKRWIGTFVPWIVALAILYFLFRRVPIDEAFDAMQHANLLLLLPASFAAILFWWLLDAKNMSYVFMRFNQVFPYREALAVRAVSYLLAAINWNVGTGGILLYLKRFRKVGLVDSMSALSVYYFADVCVLCLLTIGAVWSQPTSAVLEYTADAALIILLLTFGAYGLLLAAWPRWSWLQRIRRWRLLGGLREASFRDFATVALVRGFHFAGFGVFLWIGMLSFHAPISWSAAMAAAPLVLIAGALPITPAGLGTQQAAIVYFLRGHAGAAELLAFGLLVPVISIVGRLPLSLFYLPYFRKLRIATEQD